MNVNSHNFEKAHYNQSPRYVALIGGRKYKLYVTKVINPGNPCGNWSNFLAKPLVVVYFLECLWQNSKWMFLILKGGGETYGEI